MTIVVACIGVLIVGVSLAPSFLKAMYKIMEGQAGDFREWHMTIEHQAEPISADEVWTSAIAELEVARAGHANVRRKEAPTTNMKISTFCLYAMSIAVATFGQIPTCLSGHAKEKAKAFSVVSMTLNDQALAGAHDVQLSGNLAFVPGKHQSLSIIDISDPKKPEILWFKNDPEIPDAETVLLHGDTLLLGTLDFLTLNVKDPRNPVILKTISDRPRIGDRINGMIRIENYVIAASKSGHISAFDISDVENPTVYGVLETPKTFGVQRPHDIDRYGDYIVVVDPIKFSRPPGCIALFKVAEKGKVFPVNKWELAAKLSGEEFIGANRVQVKGDYAFTSGSVTPNARKKYPDLSVADMAVVDISNPAKPTLVAALPCTAGRGPNGLTIAGNALFCAGGQSIDVFDISNPRKPVHLTGQEFPTYNKKAKKTDNYHDLIYRDGYLYVSAQTDNGFLILKVDDARIRALADAE